MKKSSTLCLLLILTVFLSVAALNVYAGDWGEWGRLDSKLDWRVKCDRSGTGTEEWMFEFKNKTSSTLTFDYEISRGYGDQQVVISAYGTKRTYANYNDIKGLDSISIHITYR